MCVRVCVCVYVCVYVCTCVRAYMNYVIVCVFHKYIRMCDKLYITYVYKH